LNIRFHFIAMKKPKRLFSCCKVLQYKKRTTELEIQTEQQKTDLDRLKVNVSRRLKMK